MADILHTNAQPTSDGKRRKVEMESVMSGQAKLERGKGMVTDKAKANYVRLHQKLARMILVYLAFTAIRSAAGTPTVCKAQGGARMGA